MAAWKLLGPGVVLGAISAVLLFTAMATDYWYVLNARLYMKMCPDLSVFGNSFPLPVYGVTDEVEVGRRDVQTSVSTRLEGVTGGRPRHTAVVRPAPLYHVPARNVTWISSDRLVKIIRRLHSNGPDVTSRNIRTKHKSKVASLPVRRRSIEERHSNIRDKSTFARRQRSHNELNVNAWNRLVRNLEVNLHSFGGRDITVREERMVDSAMLQNKTKTRKSDYGEYPECRQLQFTTTTGLWRTCHLPTRGSYVEKLINRGNLTKCVSVSYGGLDATSLPINLRFNETAIVNRDEVTSLNLRRSVTSFLFLGAVLQTFGLIVTSLGWYRNENFEQYSGGLVLLMSGIFQLSGMCTHAILCHSEMTRQPEDIYSVHALVLHGYGTSAYAAWTSFGGTLLASFLCIMGPLHRPALPTLPCTNQTREIGRVPSSDSKPSNLTKSDAVAKPLTEVARQHKAAEMAEANPTTSTLTTQDEAVDVTGEKPMAKVRTVLPVVRSHSNEDGTYKSFTLDRDRHRVMSPVASVRTPNAAIKALQEERRELQMLRNKYSVQSDTDVYETNVHAKQHSASQTLGTSRPALHMKTRSIEYATQRSPTNPSSFSAVEKYLRKTRSLPREPVTTKRKLVPTRTRTTVFRNDDPQPRTLNAEHNRAYEIALARLDAAMSTTEHESDRMKVAELFRSSSTLRGQASSDTDCSDESTSERPRARPRISQTDVCDNTYRTPGFVNQSSTSKPY